MAKTDSNTVSLRTIRPSAGKLQNDDTLADVTAKHFDNYFNYIGSDGVLMTYTSWNLLNFTCMHLTNIGQVNIL